MVAPLPVLGGEAFLAADLHRVGILEEADDGSVWDRGEEDSGVG